ncbi:hypothetical protein GW17_00059747 [Ensete ventricosum]|nr:hypothetical protein GW17_00059747 [Ensete ventricosum]
MNKSYTTCRSRDAECRFFLEPRPRGLFLAADAELDTRLEEQRLPEVAQPRTPSPSSSEEESTSTGFLFRIENPNRRRGFGGVGELGGKIDRKRLLREDIGRETRIEF